MRTGAVEMNFSSVIIWLMTLGHDDLVCHLQHHCLRGQFPPDAACPTPRNRESSHSPKERLLAFFFAIDRLEGRGGTLWSREVTSEVPG